MSALRCKVGDLAIVVSARLEKNVGQLVEVLAPAGPDHGLRDQTSALVVKTVSGRQALHYRYLTGRVDRLATGPVPDFRLVPLRADPEPAAAATTEGLGSPESEQVLP